MKKNDLIFLLKNKKEKREEREEEGNRELVLKIGCRVVLFDPCITNLV